MKDMDKIYALCGAAFFIAFALVAVLVGDGTTARIALTFLFCAGASQFLAQGETRFHFVVASAFVALAAIFALAIVVKETFFNGVTF